MCQIYSRKGRFNCPLDCEGLWFMWRWRYLNILSSITRVWHSASAPASPWISHTAMTGIHGILESNICPDLTIQTSNLPIRQHRWPYTSLFGFLIACFLYSIDIIFIALVRFYISFENAICADYITEKTYNALKLNTIPIVLGGVNYTSLLPPKSFINAAKFITPQGTILFICEMWDIIYLPVLALAAYLYTLLQNDDLYMEYFQWRKYYNVFR